MRWDVSDHRIRELVDNDPIIHACFHQDLSMVETLVLVVQSKKDLENELARVIMEKPHPIVVSKEVFEEMTGERKSE